MTTIEALQKEVDSFKIYLEELQKRVNALNNYLEKETGDSVVRDYLHNKIVVNLEETVYNKFNIGESEFPNFIESIKDQIENTIDYAIKDAKTHKIKYDMDDDDLVEVIDGFTGDWIRDIMADHIVCFK